VTGAWETDRGDQHLAYDVWWHLNDDVAVTSEWGTRDMIEDGLDPEDLLGKRFGHHLDFWSLSEGRLVQRIDLGDEHQMVFELRPAHNPQRRWGFVDVVISVADLSASVWLWHMDGEEWAAKKVITIPAEPAEEADLPPALKPFGAVPPLVSDIDLSVDDRWLYVSCWGTGELKQYDVSDPHNPKETGSVRLGGIVDRAPHPPSPTCGWRAPRRWSRSAATAAASTSPIRSTPRGMRSSTRTASGPGWRASRPIPRPGA
jgi:methanethiol oxidase